MIRKNTPQNTGPILEENLVKRRRKRNKRRPVEAVEQDWARWDAAAAHLGLTFSEFARRALNTAASAAFKLVGVAVVLLLAACSAAVEEAPLSCSALDVVTSPAGDRLLVSCNRDVPAPPASCERTAPGRYECNIFHASADDCAALPGMCDG